MRFVPACIFSLVVAAGGAVGIVMVNLRSQNSITEPYVREKLAASAVANGHSVIFPHGMNEAVFRWDLAEQLSAAPEIVLLGSSHGQEVTEDFFPGHRFCNLCVAGGLFTDDLVSSQILDQTNKRPRHWFIIMDPWLFDGQVDFLNWQARPAELARLDRRLALLITPPATPLFLQRVQALQSSKRHFVYELDPLLLRFDAIVRTWLDRPVIADGKAYQTPTIRSDGSLRNDAGRKLPPHETELLALRQYAEKSDRHRYGSYAQIDPDLQRVFESWIRFLQNDGAQVTLVFTPYHPAIFSKIVSQSENQLHAIESKVRERALPLKVDVIGSYDPAVAGVKPEDFLDGDHLQDRGLRRLFGVPHDKVP